MQLRNQLAATFRNIQWSYAIFWCNSARNQGILAWGDGYYNGEIKTRKTTQPMEFKADQMGLQRSEQLRELYESLSDNNQQARRPSASLSPEDLTATEWYYLVCMSFTFGPGQGLPGRALASNMHIWLTDAPYADSKTFTRSLLAKSASIQTVVCLPFMGGVLELGTTEHVDKASIPGDTIEYLKELERRVEELESSRDIVDLEESERRKYPDISERTSDNYGNNGETTIRKQSANKRMAAEIEEGEAEYNQPSSSKDSYVDINITAIEKEVIIEMHCPWRDCLLLEIVNVLGNLHLDVHSVQSSTTDGFLSLTMEAKCKDSVAISPRMVKRALQRAAGKL